MSASGMPTHFECQQKFHRILSEGKHTDVQPKIDTWIWAKADINLFLAERRKTKKRN